MLATFGQISVSAQDKNSKEENSAQTQDDSSNQSANALEGSWSSRVTIRNCQTGAPLFTFPAMETYMQGGTMQDAGADSTRGPGHGVWSYQSWRRYSAVFQYFSFNADGTLAGRVKANLQNTLSKSGDSFTTVAKIKVFDTSGNLIANGCATGISTRFQ
jgi:hypothetical protein